MTTGTLTNGLVPFAAAVASEGRGKSFVLGAQVVAEQLRPTDAQGITIVTLTNMVVGSRYRIERQGDGSLATPTGNAEGVAASSTVPITLDYYGTGSANNDLRIKVRNASGSPTYKPFETLTSIGAASQSLYVGQIADE